MDYSDRAPADDWIIVTASGIFSLFFTLVYLFSDLQLHEPLFYIFLGLSVSVLAAEYGEKILLRVAGEESVKALQRSVNSTRAAFHRIVDVFQRLRHEDKLTFCGTLICFFVVVICLAQQMDDAALIYAACMMLSASPLIRKLLGQSTQKLAGQASQLFQPPKTETAELADYMPTINEISQDFSFRLRKNTNDSNATDRELVDISIFGAEALSNMDLSAMSLLNESQLGLMLESSQLSTRTTDEEVSPIPSDVDVMSDADDLLDADFPSVSSIKSGHLLSDAGSYTSSGTLRRHRKSSKERDHSTGRDSSLESL